MTFNHPLILLLLLVPFSLYYLLREKWSKYLLRMVSVCLIILALAGPELGTTERGKKAFFLADRSPSVKLTVEETKTLGKIKEIAKANKEWQFGVISFSETARLTASPGDKISKLEDLDADLSGRRTDLSSAVNLALTNLSETVSGQLILLSDGRINSGLQKAISTARENEVPISILPQGNLPNGEVLMEKIDLPKEVEPGQPFDIDVRIKSSKSQTAYLHLYRKSKLIGNWEIELKEGLNTFQLQDKLKEKGRASYKAVVTGPDDRISQNNSREDVTMVEKRADLLIVSRQADPLTSILDGIGKSYQVSEKIPSLKELAPYKGVILTGTGLSDIPTSSIQTLKKYVKEMGGGLLVIQGRKELETLPGESLEDLLPVTYKTPEIREEPRLAVIYILDTSASMQGRATGARKIQLLKETAAASIDLLDEEDLAGLITFDREYRWNAPLKPLGNGEKLYQGLRALSAAGGTDLYYPLREAVLKLNKTEGKIKHILLVTDGKTLTKDRDFPGLIARLNRSEQITVSAIATGPSPNEKLLKKIAHAGGGNYYTAKKYSDLPRISMEITRRINRKRFLTGSFKVNGSLGDNKLSTIPTIGGYVLTYPKKGARNLLSIEGDPLFSRWQFGLGKVAVLNTDLRGNWSANWMDWSHVGLFVDKIINSVQPLSPPSRYLLRPTLKKKEEGISLRVEARNPDGSYANLLNLKYKASSGQAEYSIPQIAPGVYKTEISPEKYGNEVLKIVDESRNKTSFIPFSPPEPQEYYRLGENTTVLEEIATKTRGKLLEDELLPPASEKKAGPRGRKIHLELLFAGLSLFFADLIRRKFD